MCRIDKAIHSLSDDMQFGIAFNIFVSFVSFVLFVDKLPFLG